MVIISTDSAEANNRRILRFIQDDGEPLLSKHDSLWRQGLAD